MIKIYSMSQAENVSIRYKVHEQEVLSFYIYDNSATLCLRAGSSREL